ncbi:hypothetical protein ACB098_07G115800 [Castanea mollissima]
MTDSVVSFLLENLTQLLIQESELLGGVEDQVRILKNELSLINLFLLNSEGKRHDKLVKEVVSQIRDVAYEAEDVIDTFIMTETKHRKRSMLRKAFHYFDRASALHEVAKKIERIKNDIKEIYENKNKYGIEIAESSGGDAEAEEILHRRRKDVEEDYVVGFDHDTEELEKQLIEGSSQLNVVSIIGMGGLGKTTLAKKIYNKDNVKNYFDFRCWVYVSQEYRIRELLLEILKALAPLPRVMFRAELKEELLRGLEDKYSLNEDRSKDTLTEDLKLFKEMNDEAFKKAWSEFLKDMQEPNDFKILLSGFVRDFYSKNGVKLKDMTDDELKSELLEILKEKRYLIVMDDIWDTEVWNKEKTHRTWSKYIGHVNSYLTEDRTSCIDILALSYNHLPRRLKPCFLYFGIYPEDFEIPVRQVIRLWKAEGFIRQIGNRNIEDDAEDYLEELIDRSLIQVAKRRLDGGVKTCRIHDLLRDLCISESAEEKFLEVCSDVNLSPMSKRRRISIHFANHPYISSNPCEPSNNRSVIGFRRVVGVENPLDKGYDLKWLCENNKLVRVVELGNRDIRCLIPKEIENLVLLRYLSISSGARHVIPIDSICNLWNLETLDMRNSKIECLPKGIWKLTKLRHLYLDGPLSLPITDNCEAVLPNLQVLTGIDLNRDTERLLEKVRFPNLRKLGLYSSREVESGLLSSIHCLCHLQTLKICKYLNLSNPISLQLILTKITLLNVLVVSVSIWTVLGNLTNLRILKVVGCANFKLDCNESSFCQLEIFKMVKVTDMIWNMKKGAMPRLQRLVIERCNFFVIPLDELCCLSALRDVEVLHPDPKLAGMLQQLQMRDGCKLQVNQPLESGPIPNN